MRDMSCSFTMWYSAKMLWAVAELLLGIDYQKSLLAPSLQHWQISQFGGERQEPIDVKLSSACHTDDTT